jgi:hypothetical protein
MVRNVRESWINRQTGRVKKDAFIPRRNGRDEDGLSVSQPGGDSREQLKQRLGNPQEWSFCALAAGGIRGIHEQTTDLEVCPSATERDPFHALITGVPTSPDQKALATRLAQRLAAISTPY